jgi:integrase
LKEIPIRIGEALQLKWTDIDFERSAIIVNDTEKNGKPRAFKVSQKLLNMLNALPKKSQLVFGKPIYNHMENQFCVTRRKVASRLQNPRIMQIHFHTLRHWKATMEYHRTKDILYVKQVLGHKRIENTLIYVQLAEILFKDQIEYVSKVAKTEGEACILIEAGFEFVCDFNGNKLFRKIKN